MNDEPSVDSVKKLWEEKGEAIVIFAIALSVIAAIVCIVWGIFEWRHGVAAAEKLYLGTIREQIRHYTNRASLQGLRILRAKLGNDAGVIGAALLPLEGEFSHS